MTKRLTILPPENERGLPFTGIQQREEAVRRDAPPPPPRRGGGPLLGRIARHEWRALAADRTLWWIALLFAALIGYALYNGASWVGFQERTLAGVVAGDLERSEGLRAQVEQITAGTAEPASAFRDPRRPSVAGGNLGRQHAVLPPAPLAALAVGQSDLYPSYVPISIQSREVLLAGEEIENPLHLLAGRFDLAFVIVFLFPLLILALSYNLLSQEREGGTLALLLSQPVGLRRIVAGKVLARFGAIVLLAVGLSLLGALLAGVDPAAPGAATGLALWTAVVVLYAAFWFALAVAVNALGRGSATNAVALASFWLLFVILVPGLLNTAAAALYPVPSRAEMIGATREAAREVQQEGSALLAQYYEDHPELLPEGEANLNDFATLSYAVQERVEQRIQPVRSRYEEQLARQQALVHRLRFLSPAILTQEALSDVAGTGEARYRHFLAQVDAFHAGWRGFFAPRIYRQQQLTPADLAALPAWSYREEPAAAVAGRVGGALAGLLGLTLLVGVAGVGWLRRYPMTG